MPRVYFEHAPWSPFVQVGMLWREEFGPVEQAVTEGAYPLLGTLSCNGMAVPESTTGEVELQPVVAPAPGGGGRSVMY